MAHFAELDDEHIVLRVLVVDNKNILNEDGNESEQVGIDFLQRIFGQDTKWMQCSYNNQFRGEYPGAGWYWVEELDKFMNTDNYYDYANPPDPSLNTENQ